MKNKILLIVICCLSSISSFAHSGRTNSSGCHNDYVNGGYHCHKSNDVSESIDEVVDNGIEVEEIEHEVALASVITKDQ